MFAAKDVCPDCGEPYEENLCTGEILPCDTCSGYEEELKELRVKAILSTTVLPVDGTYTVTTMSSQMERDITLSAIRGVPHYVNHPDTKAIVEHLGAVPAASKLFEGLGPGESAICVPIMQTKSNRTVNGYTSPHQAVTIDQLSLRVITRQG